LAREAGVELASPLTIPLRCVYEGGALFAIDPGAANPAYRSTEFSEVEVACLEAEAMD
jgi:hypothetical protein